MLSASRDEDGLPALITFDCTGTLFEPRYSVGALYKEALCAEAAKLSPACLEAASSISEASLNEAFRLAYGATASRHPCFGAVDAMTSEEWWWGVVEATMLAAAQGGAAALEVGDDAAAAPLVAGLVLELPRCRTEDLSACARELRPVMPAAFDELWGRTFTSARNWKLRPHALATLRTLRELRAAQPGGSRTVVGVVSNWDERLGVLLDVLGAREHLDFVVTSREAAVEKPSHAIFELAREMAGGAAAATRTLVLPLAPDGRTRAFAPPSRQCRRARARCTWATRSRWTSRARRAPAGRPCLCSRPSASRGSTARSAPRSTRRRTATCRTSPG